MKTKVKKTKRVISSESAAKFKRTIVDPEYENIHFRGYDISTERDSVITVMTLIIEDMALGKSPETELLDFKAHMYSLGWGEDIMAGLERVAICGTPFWKGHAFANNSPKEEDTIEIQAPKVLTLDDHIINKFKSEAQPTTSMAVAFNNLFDKLTTPPPVDEEE